jgi:hypothetical protein
VGENTLGSLRRSWASAVIHLVPGSKQHHHFCRRYHSGEAVLHCIRFLHGDDFSQALFHNTNVFAESRRASVSSLLVDHGVLRSSRLLVQDPERWTIHQFRFLVLRS